MKNNDITNNRQYFANYNTYMILGYWEYNGYTGSVESSDEDDCLFGKVQGLHGTLISYEGITVDELRIDFEGVIDDYVAMMNK